MNSEETHNPIDLAIDLVGRLLFWTCSLRNTINVTRFVNNRLPFFFITLILLDNT